MEKDFAGRTVFITGAAQGIGYATAQILASRGANLALADVQAAAIQKAAVAIAKEYGVKTLPVQLDVAKPEQVEKAIAEVVEKFGQLDHAVNAAGIPGLRGVGAPFAEYPPDDWDKVMAVNCNGVFYCTLHESKAMIKGGVKGSIVNISSTAGMIAYPLQTAYIASKHAVIGLTKSAGLELAAHGIRVNAVAPGFTDTQLLNSLAGEGAHLPAMAASVPFRRLCKPSEIGELTVFLLSDRASYISGSVHQSDGAHLAGVGV